MLHRIESYGDNHIEGKFVNLSFQTEHRGYWQCRMTGDGLKEFSAEPPIETLRKEEQESIKEISMIIFYFTHGEIPKL